MTHKGISMNLLSYFLAIYIYQSDVVENEIGDYLALS